MTREFEAQQNHEAHAAARELRLAESRATAAARTAERDPATALRYILAVTEDQADPVAMIPRIRRAAQRALGLPEDQEEDHAARER